jgi:translocation and assembly module TamB
MRRTLKIAAWGAGAAALLLILIVVAALIAGNTAAGRLQIEKLTARLTGGTVRLTGLGGSFPRHLSLAQLQLRDDAGVWLTARGIELDWRPLAYLKGGLQVDRLHVAAVDMQRLPQSSGGAGGEPSIPRIDVDRATIDSLQLGAQLAGAPASLAAGGSAHLRSISDMLFDASARRIDGDGSYELHLHFDAKRMDASLQLHEPANGPLENILSLPGLGDLQATINLQGLREAEHLTLALQAGALQGHADGSLNLHDLSGDLSFDFAAAAMAPRADLAWEQVQLRGRWHGSFKAPSGEGHLIVSRLKVPGRIQFAAINADITADLGRAELHAVVDGMRLPAPQLAFLEKDPVKLDASIRLADPGRPVELTATHRLFSLQGQAVTAGEQRASAILRLPNLAPFAAIAGQTVRGSATINAQADGYPAAVNMKLNAVAALVPGSQFWAAAVGERASLDFRGIYRGGVLSVESAKFSGSALTLAASGTVGETIKAKWDAELSNLSRISTLLTGTLNGSGSLAGPMSALVADAHLNSMLSVRGSRPGELSAELRAHGLPAALSGTLTAQGMLDAAPLQVDLTVEAGTAHSLHALVRQLNWKSAHLEGDVTLAAGHAAQARGELTATVGQLADLQLLLGTEIAGNLQGHVALLPDGERTSARLAVDARQVTFKGLAGDVHLAGSGFTDSFDYQLQVEIPKFNGAAASVKADGNVNMDSQRLNVAAAHVTYRDQTVRLLAPVRVDFADGVAVDSLKLGAQKAELDLKGRVTPDLSLHATLSRVGPDLINAFVPNLLTGGSIDAHADLGGSTALPTGEIKLTASNIQLADDAALGLPAANFQLTAGLRGTTADIDARLDAGSGSQLRAAGEVPIAMDGAIDMKISGKLDVGMFNPLLEARGQHAAGQIEIDGGVTGSVADPKIAGTYDLSQGGFNDYGHGISISKINAQIVGEDGTLQIKSFTASADTGTLSMSGSVGVLQPGIPVDLKINATNAEPIVSKLFTANLSADVQIKGSARERLEVSGKVHLNRTLIGIPNSLPPNVAVLDVRRRGKKTAVVADKRLVIGLDVAVQAPNEILVAGRGLDAEMGGELHIGGTTDAPSVTGGFDLQRGSFSFASSRLNFTAGRVAFNGAGLKNKIDPTLDFTAQAGIGTTTAIMRITGFADAPVFEFTSSPVLPPDEILAQLLFGTQMNQLSAFQVAQIGYALASLSGLGSNRDPLAKLQKSLGLDRLTIGAGTSTTATGQETGASIEAGRYISKRVYIEGRQSSTGVSQLQADIDLTKGLKLQTRLGNGSTSVQGTTPENDPGSSIGLIYQFEY